MSNITRLDLVKDKAQKLMSRMKSRGFSKEEACPECTEIFEALEKTAKATEESDVPLGIGGDLFFKSQVIEDHYEIEDFCFEFRKIHEALQRDADLQRRLNENDLEEDISDRRIL